MNKARITELENMLKYVVETLRTISSEPHASAFWTIKRSELQSVIEEVEKVDLSKETEDEKTKLTPVGKRKI